MGVYRRADSDTCWMSLVIDGKQVRQETGVQDRMVAEEIFAAWQVQLARQRWLGVPEPKPVHTVRELLAEYEATVTSRKLAHSQRRDRLVLARFTKWWGTYALGKLGSKVIEDYLTERLAGVTLATASKELSILKAAYAKALRWE